MEPSTNPSSLVSPSSSSSNSGASINSTTTTNPPPPPPPPSYRLQVANQNFIILPTNTTNTNAAGLSTAVSGTSPAGVAQNNPPPPSSAQVNSTNFTNLLSTAGNHQQKGKIMILTTSGAGSGNQTGNSSIDHHHQQQHNTSAPPLKTYSPFATKTPISTAATTSKFFTQNSTKGQGASSSTSSVTSTLTPSVVTLVNSQNQQILTTAPPSSSLKGGQQHQQQSSDPTLLRPSNSSYSYKPPHRVYSSQSAAAQQQQTLNKYDIVKELLDKKHREMDSSDSVAQGIPVDSLDLELADAEVKKVMGGGGGSNPTKSVSDMTEAEMAKLLESDEKLDRDSPELWPEQVPGVISFMHSTFPNFDDEEEEDENNGDTRAEDSEIIPLAPSADVPNPQQAGIIKMETDSGVSSGCSELTTVKKFSRSFDFTDYGLALSMPPGAATGQSPDASEGDSPMDDQVNGVAPESTENSSRNSPIDGILGVGSSSNDTKSGILKVATAATPTASLTAPSSSSSSAAVIVATAPKPQAATPSKPPFKPHLIPEWQKGLDDEEISMLYGFGSLTTSALLDKVKEITNLAYQLGLEEEREIARARFLDILGEGRPGGGFFANGHLTKNDFKFAESQLESMNNNKSKTTSNGNSSTKSSSTTSSSSSSSTTKRKKTNA